MDLKKSNLVSLFEEEEVPKSEESTFLNSSTVPTYEEFTKKTSKKFLFNRYLNSTQGLSRLSIVTDDESDEEIVEKFKTNSKNSVLETLKTESYKTPTKLSKFDLLYKNSKVGTPTSEPSAIQTPKTIKKSQLSESDDEYAFFEDKIVQTSFNIEEFDEKSDEDKIVEDSIIELPNEAKKSIDLFTFRDNSNIKDFNLRLSSSSGAASSETDSKKNSLSPIKNNQVLQLLDINVTQRKKDSTRPSIKSKKNSKKRVSICGQGFNDDVFNIDDTIVDQFDNEIDHKKGLIHSIIEINEENSVGDVSQPNSLFSSTKLFIDQKILSQEKSFKKINPNQESETNDKEISKKSTAKEKNKLSSSDTDDAFEKFLSQHRPKEKSQTEIKNNDLKDFIIEDSTDDESNEENNKEGKIKKKTNQKLINSRIKNLNDFKSSSESSNKSDSDEYDDQYEKDLQLFYIRTTNSLIKNEKIKKPEKSQWSSSESSQSDSDCSIIQNSSSDSENDDSFSRIFKNKTKIQNEPNKTNFKTPKRNTPKIQNDQRLVKTAFIPRKKETFQKLSFIESLSKNLLNDSLRDPSVDHYIKKFNLKSVRQELLNECYRLFNKHAFDNRLPLDMKLVWSDKITSTAGYCKYSSKDLSCEIHISTKVCTDPERLRDTLAHEMCHAAAFLISRCNDNHGPVWKSWTQRVNLAFRLIPKITVTHSYSITKKFIFRCTRCHLEIHRFSKSINIDKEVCGICHGRFEIIKNSIKNTGLVNNYRHKQMEDRFDEIRSELHGIPITPKKNQTDVNMITPRQPNKFALFVKENYGSIKKEKNLNSHKDVMQELSKNFKLLSTK